MELARGQLHILGGASGVGKTRLLLATIKRIQEGEEVPFSFSGDSYAIAVMDRYRQQTDDLIREWGIQNVEVYGLVGDNLLPSERKKRTRIVKDPDRLLIHVLEQFQEEYDVLILDPAAFFLPIGYDYVSTALSLWALSDLAASMSITILATHHAAKARKESGFKRAQ